MRTARSGLSSYRFLMRVLGREQAHREIRWMAAELKARQQADNNVPTLNNWIRRRCRGEPLQYILGSQPFGPLSITTRKPVLIPRPETEDWVDRLSKRFDPRTRKGTVSVLDLCTGTGCIPLMLAHIWPPGKVRALGVDISPEAIALAQENLESCGASGNKVDFIRGDIFDDRILASLAEKGKFDVITCNPPYISTEDYATLPESVRTWEDRLALIGEHPLRKDASTSTYESSSSGLRFYMRLGEVIPRLITPSDGMAVVEFGQGQGPQVMDILHRHFRKTELWTDQFGKERAFAGWT